MASQGAHPVPKRYVPDEMEKRVMAAWEAQGTFEAQVAAGRAAYERDPTRRFIFLEGPPTANGLPHPGHVLTRTLKDAVNRYHAMQGKWVPRKAGWDCHGLPVEIEVQKELGLAHVDDIGTKISMAEFNRKCRDSVFRYTRDWEGMSQRVGFWLDYDDPYVTMDDAYIESVWWSLKRLFDAGLLFKSYKVVPYCPQTGTSYSSHEVAQGYKDVTDTSVFVKFKLADDPDGASILSWTTTPWTLPGNVGLAVGPDIDYVKVRVTTASDKAIAAKGEVLIVAEALQKKALRNEREVIWKGKGRELVGKRYHPLFPGAIDAKAPAPWPTHPEKAFTVMAADFVTTEDGTGVVHTAVMYGEDDFQLGQREGLPAQHTVDLKGNFTARVPGLAGKLAKDDATEAAILAHLQAHGQLYRTERYEHSYPHCWRTGNPLLYYAMESWYVRMSALRGELLENNARINWVPETIQDGRMGDWLRNVKDWAFSRNRFWGTPLPVWVCKSCKHETCLGSKAELAAAGIDAPELHRPYVDRPIDCPKCKGSQTAMREPYVIDVWYDSGAAQFAQWATHDEAGKPGSGLRNKELRRQWPIDFIAEGLDQTRGWFYSLLASSTALGKTPGAKEAGLFQGPPYRNVVVNGLILAADGTKMSKSKKNYVPPDQVLTNQGADATRWYLLSATAPWQDKRFFEEAVRDTFGKFFGTLWNTFLFQHQYAGLDHWRPDQALPTAKWSQLDQWLLSRLEATVAEAREEADRFHLHKACRAIESFVIDDLSNWWVRRSRDRFWAESASQDKQSAHAALHHALHTVCRLVAPFAPFMVDAIWPHVRRDGEPSSVHLAGYPSPGPRDAALEAEMAKVRAIAEAGRALRSKVNIPTRHPLARAVLVGAQPGPFAAILQDEINVKALEASPDARLLKAYVAKPNRATLGKAFKKLAGPIADAIEGLDGDHAHEVLAAGGSIGVNVEGQEHAIRLEHVAFEEKDRAGWATIQVPAPSAAQAGPAAQATPGGPVAGGAPPAPAAAPPSPPAAAPAATWTLALYVTRDERLLAEALVREVVRRIQEVRKELDLALDAEVDLTLSCGPAEQAKLQLFLPELRSDVRARKLAFGPVPAGAPAWDLDGATVACEVRPAATRRPAAVEAA